MEKKIKELLEQQQAKGLTTEEKEEIAEKLREAFEILRYGGGD